MHVSTARAALQLRKTPYAGTGILGPYGELHLVPLAVSVAGTPHCVHRLADEEAVTRLHVRVWVLRHTDELVLGYWYASLDFDLHQNLLMDTRFSVRTIILAPIRKKASKNYVAC